MKILRALLVALAVLLGTASCGGHQPDASAIGPVEDNNRGGDPNGATSTAGNDQPPPRTAGAWDKVRVGGGRAADTGGEIVEDAAIGSGLLFLAVILVVALLIWGIIALVTRD